MNVFQATSVFICFVAAKGNFPAVIFDKQYFLLAEPTILPLSDTEIEIGFDNIRNVLYTACPVLPNQFKDNPIPEVLVWRDIATNKETYYLDELPRCELQPQVTSEQAYEAKEFSLYRIGYKEHILREVFKLYFNTGTKKTTSAEHELRHSRFISTASNKKHNFVYKKNEEFLGIDLDFIYEHFVNQILPRMVQEKSKNELAHALGIQKVQLVPQDDFALDTWKIATYWNINTVPIWKVLLLRWNAIEIYIRKVFKRDFNIKIETGICGTIEFTERYYENDTVHKLHIPKYVWKLVSETYPLKKAVLIIMHNDPFTEHQQPLCEDICAINGWLVSNNDYRTGLVYCCKMTEDIAQTLRDPNDKRYKGIFGFTKEEYSTPSDTISRILSDPREKLYDW